MLKVFFYYCHIDGFDLTNDQLILNPPEEHKPQREIGLIQEQFQDLYNELMRKHGLDYWDGALAGMIVCSVVFRYHCKHAKDIDPRVAAGIVSMGIVTAAKTAPPPLGSIRTANIPADKIVIKNTENAPKQSGKRLVLGERAAAIQEALDNGGIFIDPGTEVLSLLRQNNIDPYLIYEQALQNEIEAKIPRIDFIEANVDELYEEWRSKSHFHAPIHVRLIIWLKNHAASYGYEQIGNSWIIK